jgi:hypothetical protein
LGPGADDAEDDLPAFQMMSAEEAGQASEGLRNAYASREESLASEPIGCVSLCCCPLPARCFVHHFVLATWPTVLQATGAAFLALPSFLDCVLLSNTHSMSLRHEVLSADRVGSLPPSQVSSESSDSGGVNTFRSIAQHCHCGPFIWSLFENLIMISTMFLTMTLQP